MLASASPLKPTAGPLAFTAALLSLSLLPGCAAGGGGPIEPPSALAAETRASPEDLDFNAPPGWVLLTVELPPGYDPSRIELATIRINDWIKPDAGFRSVVDVDSDGLAELQIRVPGFCFTQSLFCPACAPTGDQTEYLVSGDVPSAGGARRFLAWGALSVTHMPDSFCGAQPYIQNESFEDSLDPWDQPDCWQYFDADDADEDDWTEGLVGFGWIEPTRERGFAHDGEYSASITVGSLFSGAGRSGFKQRVAVFGGQRNAFWAWAYVDGLTSGATHPEDRVDMELAFFDQNGNLLPTPPEAVNANPLYLDTSGWEQLFTPDFTAPPNACVMEIRLLLILNANPVGDISVWFDDAL